ncbi:MAG TPA: four helix bundle protein [Candidatus Saccharibacteria bacterium]|nr:four helix bundle protein [Candidatus Saccharibacteria bacterium]
MEENVTKAQQLQEKLVLFAASTIKCVSTASIPRSMIDQATRSVASVGANYCKAINASSKLDFRNKIYIAKKETAETKYCFQLIEQLQPGTIGLQLKEECQSIPMILQKTVNKLNDKR